MLPTIFLEAFGHLSTGTNPESVPGLARIDAEEEDLYSVFSARAELMGWATTERPSRPLFWAMHEAELTAGSDESRIGWAQVGLAEDVVEPVEVLPMAASGFTTLPVRPRSAINSVVVFPALAQCLDDALRRFGDVELSALQVPANYLESNSRSGLGALVSMLNWFNTDMKARADAIIAFDQELLGGHAEPELAAAIQGWNNGTFEFGPMAAVPEQYWVKAPTDAPHPFSPASSGLGVPVTLPEWTASAAAWALAAVSGVARDLAPGCRKLCRSDNAGSVTASAVWLIPAAAGSYEEPHRKIKTH